VFMTFSIIAKDCATGQLGIAVAARIEAATASKP